ncbi:holo-ACP synthase [Stenomitos frigidus]|nr:4'-phosphopantetheinyl transferase superfamily protein [Stenomitos frigidus]
MGIGIDLESISRVANWVKRYDRDTLSLVFTTREIDHCQSVSYPYQHYAVCFCAKEAVGKALGTGLADIGWNEIETAIDPSGLTIQLQGAAQRQAMINGVQHWLATWCCWDDYVLVHVLTY